MSDSSSSKARILRNLNEKHRRLQFKDLSVSLASILPVPTPRGSVLDLVDRAITHIRQFQERITMLRMRLRELSQKEDHNNISEFSVLSTSDNELEVNFKVSVEGDSIKLREVIDAIEEEGAEITSLSYSIAGGQLVGTIRSKAIYARIGIEIYNVEERLRHLSPRYN